MSDEYKAGTPSFVGEIPVRSDLTVLPADDPNKPKIGWTVHEYLGAEVGKQFADGRLVPLTNADDLKVGDTYYAPALFGGYHEFTVHAMPDGGLYGKNEALLSYLKFDTDDRHCWTTFGMVNTRGLKKLTVIRDE